MKKLRWIFPVIIIALLFASCEKTPDLEFPSEKIEEIRAACSDPENEFPSELITVEFLEYRIPSDDFERFRYRFRFENISEKPIDFGILSFYDPSIDKWVIAKAGYMVPMEEEHETLTLDPGMGWRFDDNLTLLAAWDDYTKAQQETMLDLAKELYFEIQIDGQIYHMILDFSEDRLIVNDYGAEVI